MDGGHINAGICEEKNAEVWARHEVSAPNVSLLTYLALKYKPPPPWYIVKWGCEEHQTCPANCWQYFVLCTGCQHDRVKGPQLNCCGTNKRNQKQWRDAHNSWITSHTTRTQRFASLHSTWYWTYTLMHRTCWKWRLATTHLDIFSWDECQKMDSVWSCVEHFGTNARLFETKPTVA